MNDREAQRLIEQMTNIELEEWQQQYARHVVNRAEEFRRVHLNDTVYSEVERPMPRRKYPEWFIGGPWHGKDRLTEAPNLHDRIQVATVDPIDFGSFLNPSPEIDLSFNRYTYVPRHANVFGELITVWVGEENVPELIHEQNSDTSRLLGQLIMSPHRNDIPGTSSFDIGPYAERHRTRYEIEREIRIELEREYGRRISSLSAQLQNVRAVPAARVTRCDHHPMTRVLTNELQTAGVLEIVDDENGHSLVIFPKVTVYFDEGNGTDEQPPSWVACAQGDSQSGDDHGKPYTGYGTTKRAAIIALLADALDVSARMVEMSEPRMR